MDKRKKMSGLREIRLSLGLSLRALACMLDVSFSQLAMAERNSRSLPADAWEKLRKLQERLAAPFIIDNDADLAAEKEKRKQFLLKKIPIIERDCNFLVKEISWLESDQVQYKNSLKVLEPERKIFANVPHYKKELDKHYKMALKHFILLEKKIKKMKQDYELSLHKLQLMKNELETL